MAKVPLFDADRYFEDVEGFEVPRVKIHYKPEVRRVEQCSIPLNGMIEAGDKTTLICNTPDFYFAPLYLIVTTSGFFIEELKLGNQSVLWRTDADVYYRANWDRLERTSELERVKLIRVALSPANKYSLWLRQTHGGLKPREFRGAFIGEAVIR
jgi:hypothetical protein